jgi:XTP/dITP diphosphohydrolase
VRVEKGDLIFATSNEHKFEEARDIANGFGVTLVAYPYSGRDIQSSDVAEIARAKARCAYAQLHRPLFVDQTSLHIASVRGFPAGYTPFFMYSFGDDLICSTFGADDSRCAAEGRTTLAYCNGQVVRLFVGSVAGRIVPEPRGEVTDWDGFGWNRVFAPGGGDKTFAEMGFEKKNAMSMRRSALKQLFESVT